MSFGTGKMWMNGKLVDWADAKIHVASHVVHYGTGVFEGARCYQTPKGAACFRLDDHIVRLLDSAKIYRMDSPLDHEGWEKAILDTDPRERAEGLLHPAADVSRLQPAGRQSAALSGRRGRAGLGMGRLSRRRRVDKGVDVCVSSWNRTAPNTFPAAAKATANYANSDADQDGGGARRLRRGHRARHDGLRQRRQRPEPVPRAART